MKRNVLLNPGPATTTDTVKKAQVVPDICPREKGFQNLMKGIREDLLKVVHADPNVYTSVLFCGSGTINMDVCLNSLLPEDGEILVINNGAYSARAVEICTYYGLPHIDLQFADNERPDLEKVEEVLVNHPKIRLVYTTHQETGTGLLNPISQIGELAHRHQAIFVVDTTSTLAMRPIDINRENIDFCMSSAQKGLMAMAGLSFIIGRKDAIVASKDYPKHSYYCNLYMQYEYFERTGQMHFTPPVQTVYALRQALDEYFAEGENAKWVRHLMVYQAIRKGLSELGFQTYLPMELETGLVTTVMYPSDPKWDFNAVHDYCYERGFTIYPGKLSKDNSFRLCSLGAITQKDIKAFMKVLRGAMISLGMKIPTIYE